MDIIILLRRKERCVTASIRDESKQRQKIELLSWCNWVSHHAGYIRLQDWIGLDWGGRDIMILNLWLIHHLNHMVFESLAFSLLPCAVLHVQPRNHVTRPASHDSVEKLECDSGTIAHLCKWRRQCQQHLCHLHQCHRAPSTVISHNLRPAKATYLINPLNKPNSTTTAKLQEWVSRLDQEGYHLFVRRPHSKSEGYILLSAFVWASTHCRLN